MSMSAPVYQQQPVYHQPPIETFHQPQQIMYHQPPVEQQIMYHQPPPQVMQVQPRVTQMQPRQGGVTRIGANATVYVAKERAQVVGQTTAVCIQVHKVAAPQHMVGHTEEHEAPAQHLQIHQDQIVQGDVKQQRHEFQTVTEQVQYMDIPETQIVERQVEVQQVVQQTVEVEQIEIVHIPRVQTQERIQHRHVEQFVDVPVPMMVEEVVHVPKVVTQDRHHHVA